MKYLTGFLLLVLVTGCDKSYHDVLLKNLFGKKMDYSIECDFKQTAKGDKDFYMCVYNLDKEDIDHIRNKLSVFPQLPEGKKGWKAFKWKRTPLANEDLPIYVRCLMSNTRIPCFKFFDHNDMQGQGSYYAAFYRGKKNDPKSADLFILIPQKGQLVFISKEM